LISGRRPDMTMPSSFCCSSGTYGDGLWTTELQKRLTIFDQTADLITVGNAKPWRKSGLHPSRRKRIAVLGELQPFPLSAIPAMGHGRQHGCQPQSFHDRRNLKADAIQSGQMFGSTCESELGATSWKTLMQCFDMRFRECYAHRSSPLHASLKRDSHFCTQAPLARLINHATLIKPLVGNRLRRRNSRGD
jgi:hypothetical protein